MIKKIIPIFLFFLVHFSVVIVVPAFADDSAQFQQYLSYADSLNGQVSQSGKQFDPQKTFQKNYNPHPTEEKYFNGVTQSGDNHLDHDAVNEVSKDTAGSAIDQFFETRPVFKVNQQSEAIQKGKFIQSDAMDISHGVTDKYVDCQQVKNCTTTYENKTCDEETRFMTKECTQTPQITIQTVPVIYPHCQQLLILEGAPNSCPNGYTQVLYVHMVDGSSWGDTYFCTQDTPNVSQNASCYTGGFFIARLAGDFFGNHGQVGEVTVPQHLTGHLVIQKAYDRKTLVVTLINETTGQTLDNQVMLHQGDVIDLPVSASEDQTFKFFATESTQYNEGAISAQIDHQGTKKMAQVNWTKTCHKE